MCKCSICNSTYNLNEFENCNIRDIMLLLFFIQIGFNIE